MVSQTSEERVICLNRTELQSSFETMLADHGSCDKNILQLAQDATKQYHDLHMFKYLIIIALACISLLKYTVEPLKVNSLTS